MSYEAERTAIERWFSDHWAAFTPWGPVDKPFTPTAGSVQLHIQNGQALRTSMGQPGFNTVEITGVLQIQIYVEGATNDWRPIMDKIEEVFIGAKMNADGYEIGEAPRCDGQIFFGLYDQLPYVSGKQDAPPFTIVTVNCPFIRVEMKG